MNHTRLEGQEQAEKIALLYQSPRALRLDGLEKWSRGRQYDGLPNFWSDEVPLWERAPCIVYPVVKIAAQSNVSLCLGDTRFPGIAVSTAGEAADEVSPVDTCLTRYHQLCRFPAACREALEAGQVTGTVVAIQGARLGVPFIDLIPAKWCSPPKMSEGKVVELEIRYPYLEEYKDPSGRWRVRCRLYRRVIDAVRDTVFLPGETNDQGTEPIWKEDAEHSSQHDLGFCPVVWYSFMAGCQPVNSVDGRAIHVDITDEIRAHDIARSQWHRGALLSEPQQYEIGVEPGFNPTGTGRTALVPSTEHGGVPGPGNPVIGHFNDGTKSKNARKKGPGYVAQYPNPDTKIGVLSYPDGALKAQQDNCSDLRIKIQEALAVVFLDPENIKFAATTSGKALEAIRQKQLDRCDEYRDDFRDRFIEPTVRMQLAIIKKLGSALKVPGVAEAAAAIGSPEDSHIEVKWGAYFKPDPLEQQQILDMVLAALSAKVPVITLKKGLEKLAEMGVFAIGDVDKFLEELTAEREESRESELTTLRRMGVVTDEAGAGTDPPPVRPGGNRGRPQDGEVDAGAVNQS